MKSLFYGCLSAICFAPTLYAQSVENINFGDMDSWRVRMIKESAILGGETKTVYAIANNDTVYGPEAYVPKSSPWATSNVLAIVSGITKTSNTVFPETRGDGRSVRMETMLVTCKVLGIVNISVVASGSIFLGRTIEPIRNTSNPYEKLDMGIPFKRRPKAVIFDYNATISDAGILTKATGLSVTQHKGNDPAEVFLLLQQRWEDEHGNLYARRIGTAKMKIGKSSNGWVDGYSMPVVYGKEGATEMPLTSTFYARNSRGKCVVVKEVEFGNPAAAPTHIVLMFSSGSCGAYTGALGNKLRVDNVKLSY